MDEEHPDMLMANYNLSLTYWKQGLWPKAESLQTQVLGVQKQMLGKDYPDTLRSMHNLVIIYHDLGQWDEVESLQV